jgi:hypothetical protein
MGKRKNKPRVALTFGSKRVVVKINDYTGNMHATLETRDGTDAMDAQRWKAAAGPFVQSYQDGTTRRYWRESDVNDLLAAIFERIAEVKRIARRRKTGGAS